MKKLFLVLYVSINLILCGQTKNNYMAMIDQAESLTYNFDFDSSQVFINRAIELDSLRPEAFQLRSKIHLWYYLGSKEKSDYDSFFHYSDSALYLIDQMLVKNHENKDLLYQLGNLYKNRAMAYGSYGNTLDAFWATKKAVSFYEDVIDIDSNYYSAYGGIGIFEYALSYVPALFNWALALSGLSADQNNGFDLVEIACENGKMDKYEYKFHLAKLYDEHLADYHASLKILNQLLTKFPNNILFHYQAAIEYLKSHNLEAAEFELKTVLDLNHPKFVQTISFSNFLLGDIYFRKLEYEKALDYYLEFLSTTQTVDYTGIGSLRTAICYYFLNNENEFKRYALLASNGNLDIEEDKIAKQKGLEFLAEGFSLENEILINAENSYLSGDYNYLLEIDSDSLQTENIKAQILLYKSNVSLLNENISDAELYLSEIDSLDLKNAEWVEPYMFYNLAKIYYLKNDFISASNFLEMAEDSNDYQQKFQIQSYVNGLRRKLTNNN